MASRTGQSLGEEFRPARRRRLTDQSRRLTLIADAAGRSQWSALRTVVGVITDNLGCSKLAGDVVRRRCDALATNLKNCLRPPVRSDDIGNRLITSIAHSLFGLVARVARKKSGNASRLRNLTTTARFCMKLIFVVSPVILTAPAHSKTIQFQTHQYLRTFTVYDTSGNRFQIIDPPKYWFQRPAPSTINISIVKDDEASALCKNNSDAVAGVSLKKILGCAIREPHLPDQCDIYINESLAGISKNIVINHEKAHCHGWPQYHPTSEPVPVPRANPIGALP